MAPSFLISFRQRFKSTSPDVVRCRLNANFFVAGSLISLPLSSSRCKEWQFSRASASSHAASSPILQSLSPKRTNGPFTPLMLRLRHTISARWCAAPLQTVLPQRSRFWIFGQAFKIAPRVPAHLSVKQRPCRSSFSMPILISVHCSGTLTCRHFSALLRRALISATTASGSSLVPAKSIICKQPLSRIASAKAFAPSVSMGFPET
mmetsp:Transcript_10169/g.24242  ORF Transcript_10169/g.24242 Transcript_10169/m.24242 type:complete len:206 (+) Transcript_10169:301-918(+)